MIRLKSFWICGINAVKNMNERKIGWTILGIAAAIILTKLALFAGAVYLVMHFVLKYW